MGYLPNANWDTARAERFGSPVYFLRIDGLSTDYSTGYVKNASTTKVELMEVPTGSATTIDLVEGVRTAQSLEVELLDVGGQITTIICSEAVGAPLPTLVNRKAEVFGGYAELDEADYALIRTGRITGVRMNANLTGYVLTITDVTYLLEGQIMKNARDNPFIVLTGNPVNIYWAILTGTFSTTDPDFPLLAVSNYAAPPDSPPGTPAFGTPTGLNIPTTLINEDQLIAERDLWHPDTIVRAAFTNPEKSAKRWFERELFKGLQCRPTINGAGQIGLKFTVPAIGAITTLEVRDDTNLVEIESWRRRFDLHYNEFVFRGDLDNISEYGPGGGDVSNQYENDLYDETTDADLADQTETEEVFTFLIESGLVRSELDGASIAAEIMGRARGRFLKTPIEAVVLVNFTARNIEEGEVIALTTSGVPHIVDGTMGVEGRLVTVAGVEPLFAEGLLRLTLLDTNTRRYGLISPGGLDYATATPAQRERYLFVAGLSGTMSDGSMPYRWI